ncbi:MAG: CoA ester lyase [Proteobacteria bacterium]|jgi:(3S)-malyl-CoA thioesterase|nr:CoA ester lyase [Pseudomonadota bacterium]MDA1237377.1 CoA ester lyase [Pseudomonadota bacterium]
MNKDEVMETEEFLCRSVLYVPGSKPRSLEKCLTLAADVIILDLEDSVLPSEKVSARRAICEFLKDAQFGRKKCFVRINDLSSEWGVDDLHVVCSLKIDAVVVPKVEESNVIKFVSSVLDAKLKDSKIKIWAMIETPLGVVNSLEIAAAPKMQGFVLGTNDLAKELKSRSRKSLGVSLQNCLLSARSHYIMCVDGVYNKFKDLDGLLLECEEGRDIGFDGKSLLHPAQIPIANKSFGLSDQEIKNAKEQILAFEKVKSLGQGVAVLDGKIIENLHVLEAEEVLRKELRIKAMEN